MCMCVCINIYIVSEKSSSSGFAAEIHLSSAVTGRPKFTYLKRYGMLLLSLKSRSTEVNRRNTKWRNGVRIKSISITHTHIHTEITSDVHTEDITHFTLVEALSYWVIQPQQISYIGRRFIPRVCL